MCTRLSQRLRENGLAHEVLAGHRAREGFAFEACVWRGFEIPVEPTQLLLALLTELAEPQRTTLRDALSEHLRLTPGAVREAVFGLVSRQGTGAIAALGYGLAGAVTRAWACWALGDQRGARLAAAEAQEMMYDALPGDRWDDIVSELLRQVG